MIPTTDSLERLFRSYFAVFGDLNLTRQIKHESYSKSEGSADSSALELHRQRAKRSCARTQRVPRAKRLRLALVGMYAVRYGYMYGRLQ